MKTTAVNFKNVNITTTDGNTPIQRSVGDYCSLYKCNMQGA